MIIIIIIMTGNWQYGAFPDIPRDSRIQSLDSQVGFLRYQIQAYEAQKLSWLQILFLLGTGGLLGIATLYFLLPKKKKNKLNAQLR